MSKLLAECAAVKYQKVGSCPNSVFPNGAHRAGIVAVTYIHACCTAADGFADGEKFLEICVDCLEVFSRATFYFKKPGVTIFQKGVTNGRE